MTSKRSSIAQQIDRLDHPDATHQDAILREFSNRVDDVRPVVLANLPVVGARVRRALLRWLGDHLSPEVSLPLMRYVFDERGTIAEQSGRSLAMGWLIRRAKATEVPEERGRLRAFAEDICADDEPEIRRQALEILSYVGNRESIPIIAPYRDDVDEDVQHAAAKAWDALQDAPARGAAEVRPAPKLLGQLINSAGPRRRQLVQRWRQHDERGGVAVEILRNRGDLRREALQILLQTPDPKARPFLASIILDDPDGPLAPLALRLLAKIAEPGSAGPDEIAAVRHCFRSPVLLNQTASCAAIGALQLNDFIPLLVEVTYAEQISLALEAAKALAQCLDASHGEYVEEISAAVQTQERRRRQAPNNEDRVQLLAHLLSALRALITATTIGVESAHRAAFSVLETASHKRSLRVTGIQVVMASTPEDGLDEFAQWSDDRADVLFDLLVGADRPTVKRIAQLMVRGVAGRWPAIDDATRRLWKTGYVDLAEVIVPLLERSGSGQAMQWLEEIGDGDDRAAARAARQILRSVRNTQDVIDAEFIPPDDS